VIRPFKNIYQKGLTLIELLVVVVIIAGLISLVVPALKTAREVSRRVYDQSSIHMLTAAWNAYSAEHHGMLVDAKTTKIKELSPSRFDLDFDPENSPNPTWAGIWKGSEDNLPALEAAITMGTLYPYNQTLKIYRCSNHKSYNKASPDRPQMFKRIRSFAIVDAINGYDIKKSDYSVQGGTPIGKMSEITNAGTQVVFIDEGLETSKGWSIYPDRQEWWDLPPIQHGNGLIVSYADNHTEYRKWQDERTVQYAQFRMYDIGTPISPANSAANNPDFIWIQQAIWGQHRGN
jgi:prepilin-type N-terminal cleavage/methylation domain-containing protein